MSSVLFIGNYPPPYGGVPLHIERLTAHRSALGMPSIVLSGGTTGTEHKGPLTVVKPGYPRKLLAWGRSRRTVLDDWIGDGSFPTERPGEWRRYRLYVDVGRELIRRHDIGLIASYNLLGYGPIGAALAAEFGLPHVHTVFGEIYKNPEFVQRNRSFLARVLDEADVALSCSQHCANSAAAVLGTAERVRAITYGINLGHFSDGANGAAVRSALGITQPKVMLFLARLGREMGLDLFLSAATELLQSRDDLHVLIVGQANDLAEEASRFVSQHAGKATLLVNHPYAELPACYAAADVLAVPTRGARTCSSLAAMEGMAVGVPVVAAALGGIPEIIRHEDTGLLFPPEDAAALAAGIRRVLDDDALAARLKTQGLAEAQAQFSEDRVNFEMQAMFARLMGSA